MSTLFEAAGLADGTPHPLADRLRPKTLDDVLGQDHVLGAGGPLRRMLDSGRLPSLILWGPPGTGKTTIARLLADRVGLDFIQLSAVFSGVADLRKAIDSARERRQIGRGTLLFVDEIHRFNRAQQDGFLPVVEDGTIVLVGATTENPSFELNAALLSRCQVLVLNRLEDADLEKLLDRAEVLDGKRLPLTAEARRALRGMSDGDGRYLLNLTEDLFAFGGTDLDTEALVKALQKRAPIYDKSRDEHFNLFSALHKSLRGSDADAALYWLARMLAGGEAPLYIVRRLVRFAVEDIGLADPEAVHQALAAKDTYDFLGSPEGELAIAQAVIYLATAPKSNAAYTALKKANRAAAETGSLAPPKHILNAPTGLMKDLGYGDGYVYDHDAEDVFSGRNYFPDAIPRPVFYVPTERGFEREVGNRLAHWRTLREKAHGPKE
ncbi:MAG: replication-associated recombination protein A [Proteobacteria bacterium]|nr:replication-associated recombination protein A [Pseudomonadota bacterium]MDA1059527.1 replication-associated recombination protein A [Pseudomonadota bacterium]